LHAPAGNNVEGVSRRTGLEQDLAAFDRAGLNVRQDVLDVVGRQVTQEIAICKQGDQVLDLLPFASNRILLKPGRQSDRGAASFQVEICTVIDESSEREPPAHEGPGRLDAKRPLVELLSSVIAQFDSERADEGTRREREDCCKDDLRQSRIKAQSSPKERRGGRRKPKKRNDHQIPDTGHLPPAKRLSRLELFQRVGRRQRPRVQSGCRTRCGNPTCPVPSLAFGEFPALQPQPK
jgi:hypothetical protein